jgi:acyl-CoA thioester hydrolase
MAMKMAVAKGRALAMNKMSRQIAVAEHVHGLRVYWEDTDAAGVVYYANYLKYAERARSEILYGAGIDQTELRERGGIVFAVRSCHAEYLAPARLGDQLQVHTSVIEFRGASFRLCQTVRRGGEDLVVMEIRLACLDPGGKPARLPDAVKAVLSQSAD